MVQPFTKAARRCVVLAQQEARLHGSDRVGTDHLLLGLLGEGSSMAGEVLRGLGVMPESVRREAVTAGSGLPGEMLFTDETRRTFELAFEEARRLGHARIAPPHLVLGMIRHGGGAASRVLARLQVDPMRVRAAVVGQLGHACPSCLDSHLEHGCCPGCGARRRGLPGWAWVVAACLAALVTPLPEWLAALARLLAAG